MIRWTLIVVLIAVVPCWAILLLTDHTLIGYITAGVGGFVGGMVANWDQKRREAL